LLGAGTPDDPAGAEELGGDEGVGSGTFNIGAN
jgi:hypothetical protein